MGRELWIGSKDSNPKAEVPGDVVRRSKQQNWRRQRLRWRRRPRHSWLGRRPLATTTLRLRHARCTEQRLKGSLRVTPRVRRGCFGGDPRGRLLRAACGRNEKGGSAAIAAASFASPEEAKAIRNFMFLGFQPLAPGHEFMPSNPNLVCFFYTI